LLLLVVLLLVLLLLLVLSVTLFADGNSNAPPPPYDPIPASPEHFAWLRAKFLVEAAKLARPIKQPFTLKKRFFHGC
jgi:hypothetical protein